MIYDLTSVEKTKKVWDDLHKKVFEKRPFFAFVHADWCFACQRALPAWKTFSKKMKTQSFDILDISDIGFNFIMTDESKSFLGKKLKAVDVKGFPTFFYVDNQVGVNGKVKSPHHAFQGERTVEAFTEFVKQFDRTSHSGAKSSSTKSKK